MRVVPALALGLTALLMPALAVAHPHIWIQQVVRVVAKDGKYTHVEIEWRFDPYSSEVEIPLIDEDKNGSFSAREIKALEGDMMPELKNYGYMTWLNVGGGKDVRPIKPPAFAARIDDPASFTLPDWDRSAGDGGMAMPQNKQASEPPGPRSKAARNLVYVMRFELPQPTRLVQVTTFDPDDFIRVEVNKDQVPAGCMLAKHPTYKAEFVRGYPVQADSVTCQLP